MFYSLNNWVVVGKDHGLCLLKSLISGDSFFGDESSYVFLSSLRYEPESIDDISRRICSFFVDANINEVKRDAVEFFDYLVPCGVISRGNSREECKSNSLPFTYEKRDEILRHLRSLNVLSDKNDLLSTVAPKIEYVLKNAHIELTTICNERCIHCYIPHEDKVSLMDMDLFYKILNELKSLNVESVGLSGGECMMHPSFSEILKAFKRENIRVRVLTNLTLLTEDIARVLSEGMLSSVQVSLFSLDEKIHDAITAKKGSWKKTMENIELLRRYNVPLEIVTQCFKETKDSVIPLMRWCDSKGYLFSFDWDIIGKINGDTSNLDHRINDLSEYKDIITSYYDSKPGYDYGPISSSDKESHVCDIGVSRVSIGVNGDVYPCVGLSGYSLGNIKERSLKDIWENSDKLNYLRKLRLKDFPKCSECVDKDYCTVCMQYNNAVTHDILTPDRKKCELTHMMKEFMVSRIKK